VVLPVTRRRFAVALVTGVAIILSAPVAQQLFTEAGARWPGQFRAIGIGATGLPAGAALLFAAARIRDRHLLRCLALVLSAGVAVGYVLVGGLSFGESFHFVEYGLLAVLLYRAWRSVEDGSVFVLPALAGILVATLDEWFQWFIPIRVGEARDVALNGVAIGCGLLLALAIDPPDRLTLALRAESRRWVGAWAAAAVVVFGLFFQSVHLGYTISDDEGRTFRSRFSPRDLVTASDERAVRWRASPPIAVRRLSREDQYLSEGLWHVQRRNEAWSAGDARGAWHEHRILETFYSPVLDAPSYVGAAGQRWPPGQRADAAARAAADRRPYTSDAHPFPLYSWPKAIVWGAQGVLLAAVAAVLWLNRFRDLRG
jgi:hypothetical protein